MTLIVVRDGVMATDRQIRLGKGFHGETFVGHVKSKIMALGADGSNPGKAFAYIARSGNTLSDSNEAIAIINLVMEDLRIHESNCMERSDQLKMGYTGTIKDPGGLDVRNLIIMTKTGVLVTAFRADYDKSCDYTLYCHGHQGNGHDDINSLVLTAIGADLSIARVFAAMGYGAKEICEYHAVASAYSSGGVLTASIDDLVYIDPKYNKKPAAPRKPRKPRVAKETPSKATVTKPARNRK